MCWVQLLSAAAAGSVAHGPLDSLPNPAAPTLAAAAAAGTTNLRAKLTPAVLGFHPLDDVPYLTHVEVGIFFDHLFEVNDQTHSFSGDFYTVYTWKDNRDFSPLFSNPSHLHSPATTCAGEQALSSVELGEDMQELVWKPDLHVANVDPYTLNVKWTLLRIFARKDGHHTVEMRRLHAGKLGMTLPNYFNFPFDEHELPIKIESRAFSPDRIVLSVNNAKGAIGVTTATHTWPGWTYVSHTSIAEAVFPEDAYNQGACAIDRNRRSQVSLKVLVKRAKGGYQKGNFLPTHLLVFTSYAGFWLKHSALMPRIATAFISFLTLTSWSVHLLSTIPKVTYSVWLTVFMEYGRLFMLFALAETIVGHVIATLISTRTAIALDVLCRWFVPLCYCVLNLILYNHRSSEDDVKASENLLFAALPFMIVVAATYTFVRHRLLMRQLATDPLGVFLSSTHALDPNEVDYLFKCLDVNDDQALSTKELVTGILAPLRSTTQAGLRLAFAPTVELTDAKRDEIITALAAKHGEALTREQFRAAIRPMLSQLCHLLRMRSTRSNDAKVLPVHAKVTPPEQGTGDDVRPMNAA